MENKPSALWSLLRTIFFASLFVGFVLLWIPRQIARAAHGELDLAYPNGVQLLGAVLIVTSLAVLATCFLAFAWEGRGTPAPFDPPRFLVRGRPYQYVRNPMYLGAAAFVLGQALLYRPVLWALAQYGAVVFVLLHLLVVLYEEPVLRRKFGADYEDYCQRVPRWIPRLKPRH